MVNCDKCGKWFYTYTCSGNRIVPPHDCKWGGPTNPLQDRIDELEKEVKELKEKLK